MKVIGKSNHDKETDSDTLVCENVTEFYGKKIVKALNAEVSDYSSTFYVLVADDYQLYVWEP